MPDDLLPHLRFNAPHDDRERLTFRATGGSRDSKPPFARDRATHAQFLRSQLGKIDNEFFTTAKDRRQKEFSSEFGLTLNVASEPGYPLAFTSLENAGGSNSHSIV